MKQAVIWSSAAICVLGLTVAPISVRAQSTPVTTTVVDWGPLKQLVGHWVADSSGGQPGVGTRAEATFVQELDGQVLVRRDHSEYAAANGRPATIHDGLLVIYPTGVRTFAAHSYDNEGHVIDYAVAATDRMITFTSAVAAGAPRFRLSYVPIAATMQVRFEIAPPGQPEAFQLYVSGITRRTSP
jgi:hypothetical protein